MTMTLKRHLTAILSASALCGGLLLVTSGCGPTAQQVTAPAPVNNVPPGGGSADEYAKKMAELKGGASHPGGGSTGAHPGPGGK